MPAKRFAQTTIVCVAALIPYLIRPATLFAQAWVPEKGSGSVSSTYSNIYVRNHVNFIGIRNPNLGRIRTNTILTSFDYGITNRLALNADLAHVSSKYIGVQPHGPNDTGSYHPTFQDAHIELRYNALSKSVVVTPFIGATIPTHDYEVRGHSAVGRGFHELLLGVNVGRQLDRVLRDSYVHGRYSYAILGRFEGLNLNRSNADWEVGWFANKQISLRLLGDWQTTHGGFDFPRNVHHAGDFDIHDRVARAKFIHLGGGFGFSVSTSFGVHAAYLTTVYARNSHAAGGVLLGMSWIFARGLGLSQTAANTWTKNFPTLAQITR